MEFSELIDRIGIEPYYLDLEYGQVIYCADCRSILPLIPDKSIDLVLTDPPYNLGFMSKKWDKTGIAFNLELWGECLRVIKPGGNLLSFGGTRTYHRMVCAIEDAGFEIRDCIMYVYGSGFPKSLNIGKAIDKLQGNKREDLGESPNWRPAKTKGGAGFDKLGHGNVEIKVTKGNSEWEGYGTGLKPAYEPIVLAMKPLNGTFAENCLKWGVGGLNIDRCRIPFLNTKDQIHSFRNGSTKRVGIQNWDKPSLKEMRTQDSKGRFPANFIHDGSQEVMELFPESKNNMGQNRNAHKGNKSSFGLAAPIEYQSYYGETGSAARFFYCAKASKKERNMGCEDLEEIEVKLPDAMGGSKHRIKQNGDIESVSGYTKSRNYHPTVKPLALMEYLVKLVTRPGHIVLDPFIGSGTTAMACVKLGRHYIGCELDKGYYDIAIKRIAQVDK